MHAEWCLPTWSCKTHVPKKPSLQQEHSWCQLGEQSLQRWAGPGRSLTCGQELWEKSDCTATGLLPLSGLLFGGNTIYLLLVQIKKLQLCSTEPNCNHWEFPVSAGPLGLLKGASSPPQTQQSLVFSRKLPFKVNCHSVNWTLLIKKQRTTAVFFKD